MEIIWEQNRDCELGIWPMRLKRFFYYLCTPQTEWIQLATFRQYLEAQTLWSFSLASSQFLLQRFGTASFLCHLNILQNVSFPLNFFLVSWEYPGDVRNIGGVGHMGRTEKAYSFAANCMCWWDLEYFHCLHLLHGCIYGTWDCFVQVGWNLTQFSESKSFMNPIILTYEETCIG